MLPQLSARVDYVPGNLGEMVVCFGRPEGLPDLPPERLIVFEHVDDATVEAVLALDPKLMGRGLIIVTTRQAYATWPAQILRAQKALVFRFVKFVYLPNESTRIPDLMELRESGGPPEFLHTIQRHRNAPLHLTHPIIDKLADEDVGLPCLLLLPGPSLAAIAPHMQALAKRYLVVTISRALPFLRQCGVKPDVLLQLDTLPMQAHFHHPGDAYPETALLALTMSPVSAFARRFGHLFFIDSFNLSVLHNEFRIRESWLSSFLACLGAAEALRASQVLVAGGDLRICGENVYYCDPAAWLAEHQGDYQEPMSSNGLTLTFADAYGREASTTQQYLATAWEAEQFAREIKAAIGTEFHNLSTFSILDPTVFSPLKYEEAQAAPELDKSPFLLKVANASAKKEQINLRSLKAQLTRHTAEARRQWDAAVCLYANAPEAVQKLPGYTYVQKHLSWFRAQHEEHMRKLTVNLLEEHYRAHCFAKNITAMHLLASRGKAIPVLCNAEEEEATLQALGRYQQDWSWRFLGIVAQGSGRAAPSGGALNLQELHDWLQFQEVVIIAKAIAVEYHYALQMFQGENCLSIAELEPFMLVL